MTRAPRSPPRPSRAATVAACQACYLPSTPDGLPAIGRVPGEDNAYVAAVHSFWGIFNSPATGRALAEMIVLGESRALDAAPFSPARFAAARRG